MRWTAPEKCHSDMYVSAGTHMYPYEHIQAKIPSLGKLTLSTLRMLFILQVGSSAYSKAHFIVMYRVTHLVC